MSFRLLHSNFEREVVLSLVHAVHHNTMLKDSVTSNTTRVTGSCREHVTEDEYGLYEKLPHVFGTVPLYRFRALESFQESSKPYAMKVYLVKRVRIH